MHQMFRVGRAAGRTCVVARAMMSNAWLTSACSMRPALVRAMPRPSARISATPRLRYRFCRWRETTVWLTASSSPAARTLPLRPTASKARNAMREGNRGRVILAQSSACAIHSHPPVSRPPGNVHAAAVGTTSAVRPIRHPMTACAAPSECRIATMRALPRVGQLLTPGAAQRQPTSCHTPRGAPTFDNHR